MTKRRENTFCCRWYTSAMLFYFGKSTEHTGLTIVLLENIHIKANIYIYMCNTRKENCNRKQYYYYHYLYIYIYSWIGEHTTRLSLVTSSSFVSFYLIVSVTLLLVEYITIRIYFSWFCLLTLVLLVTEIKGVILFLNIHLNLLL